MKQIVVGKPVAFWVGDRLGRTICPPYGAIGLEIDGQLEAGAVFNLWTGPNVHVSVVGTPRSWTRIFLRRLATYAFEELGCLRVTLTTEQEMVADLCRRLGGQHEGTLRNAFGAGRDGLVFGILRDEWRI